MNLDEISTLICERLQASSYHDEAKEIEELVKKVLLLDKKDPLRTHAIQTLISRCHIKWLGDYYIHDISFNEWTNLISLFKRKLIEQQ